MKTKFIHRIYAQAIIVNISGKNKDIFFLKKSLLCFSYYIIDLQKKENGDINNCRNTKKTLRNLRNTELKCFFLFVFFSDPPTVKVETSALEHLEDEKDSVTLRCKVDSNPVGAILWRKDGLEEVTNCAPEILFFQKQDRDVIILVGDNMVAAQKIPSYAEQCQF